MLTAAHCVVPDTEADPETGDAVPVYTSGGIHVLVGAIHVPWRAVGGTMYLGPHEPPGYPGPGAAPEYHTTYANRPVVLSEYHAGGAFATEDAAPRWLYDVAILTLKHPVPDRIVAARWFPRYPVPGKPYL